MAVNVLVVLVGNGGCAESMIGAKNRHSAEVVVTEGLRNATGPASAKYIAAFRKFQCQYGSARSWME